MKDKYSHPKREQYGRRLAAHLCDQHFAAQPQATLDGPAVLRFTPIRQVNLFVVQQLLAQWTQEMANLRSPYFNFEAADVRQALTQFMNLLSRHIQLTRATFAPLLARAISDTLGIVAEPTATLEEKLLGSQPVVQAQQLRDALRYFEVDKALYQGFVDSLPAEEPLKRADVVDRFRHYQQANYTKQQPMDKLVAEFSALLPLTTADLLEDGPVAAAAPAAEPAPAPKPAEPEPAELKPTEPKPALPTPTPAPAAAAPPALTPAPAPATPRPASEPTGAAPRLYEKLKSEHAPTPTLSETLRPERPNASLAEKAPKVESLREAISINQRFSFINELFSGENLEYYEAIQHLDALPNAEAAKRYVTDELVKQHDWSRKEEHVQRLLRLIDRKFA